jgi:lipoyl(octanoyl) transferase
MDLSPFLRINPCGYAGLEMTQTASISSLKSTEEAGQTLIKHMSALLGADTISYQTGLESLNDH